MESGPFTLSPEDAGRASFKNWKGTDDRVRMTEPETTVRVVALEKRFGVK